jgi:hypothetical protein
MTGSATFNATDTRLQKATRARFGRRSVGRRPLSRPARIPTKRISTDKSRAGAISGAIHGLTPSFSARLRTFPNPNRNVRAITTPIPTVVARLVIGCTLTGYGRSGVAELPCGVAVIEHRPCLPTGRRDRRIRRWLHRRTLEATQSGGMKSRSRSGVLRDRCWGGRSARVDGPGR